MRIIIDMQGAQTASRLRGIGRYTLALTQAIVRNRGEHEIILALNGLFPETIEPIRTSFEGLLSQKNIRVWHTPSPLKECESGNTLRRKTGELIREAFLASLQPDVVLIASLFEGYMDDAATSIGQFDQTTPVSVILYDLIPLLNPDQYLAHDPAYEQHYLRKIEHLRHATLLLAISDSSLQEGIIHLGLQADFVTNISTAADAHFRSIWVSKEQKQLMQCKYGITRPFVMYIGADDRRKNIDGLIRAYSLLPDAVRAQHQLLIICPIKVHDRIRLENLGNAHQLARDELLLVGHVPDDDLLLLYNLCKMFVFPSWHEGFGLPALEAMACGRAVIGSNVSSLPEVIGREDALFNPRSDISIAEKIGLVLSDDVFRAALEQHGLQQAQLFKWEFSAQRAITALEKYHSRQPVRSAGVEKAAVPISISPTHKPKLAYISPLPPERSGVANYSAELLPALRKYFNVELVTDQSVINLPSSLCDLPVHSAAWFDANGHRFDRIIYHVGNSPFHSHMLDLLDRHPGVVMLHDFFLSSMLAYRELSGETPDIWTQSLYYSHGYHALLQRFSADGPEHAKNTYPCNLDVLQSAQGVIVHSSHSQRLACQWYGAQAADNWHLIPLLRHPPVASDRIAARKALGIGDDVFVVCSFGFIDPTKLSHRLLDAWLSSRLCAEPNCELILVGENHGGEYGLRLSERIRASGYGGRIRITGWADMAVYELYLQAADSAVQMRNMSRGETSSAVLDCLNYGLPTIVNAHGSMADLPDEATWKLPDTFSDPELVNALEILWSDKQRRSAISQQALQFMRSYHTPEYCAGLYAVSIEKFYQASVTDVASLTSAIANLLPPHTEEHSLMEIARAISHSIPVPLAQSQLLIDVSTVVLHDDPTDVAHVAHRILFEWLTNPPQGFRVEPVYATLEQGYRYARNFTLDFLGCPASALSDEPIEFRSGDRFIGLAAHSDVVVAQQHSYQNMLRQGVGVQFLVYDLSPILMPHTFTEGATADAWLKIVTAADGAICTSKAMADQLLDWHKANQVERLRPLDARWFYLGSDLNASTPTKELPDSTIAVLKLIKESRTFLAVGAAEPGKELAQVVAAFKQLWTREIKATLVIVGNAEELGNALAGELRSHHEFGRRLIWIEDISDEYLEEIYASTTCLIAAGTGVVFGLSLIEAAQHSIPIIARDVPIFRKAMGEHACYFSGSEPWMLADVIVDWLQRYELNAHPHSGSVPRLTWKQSADQLLQLILQEAEPDISPKIQHSAVPTTNILLSHQLLVDVSSIVHSDLHTGIERVVRAQLLQLMRNPPDGFRIEPVYFSDMDGVPHYRYARRYAHKLLAIETANVEELPVTVNMGDIFYGADFCPGNVIEAGKAGIYAKWRKDGVKVNFLIYDILPVLRPEFFPDQTDKLHVQWLKCIAENADKLICISRSVAGELSLWFEQQEEQIENRFQVTALHIGADIAASFPSSGMPDDAAQLLRDMKSTPYFLMVGTIEPRKGHLQTLAAFEQLWRDKSPAKLVIVGREGWKSLQSHQRRTIPQIIEKLNNHPELGKRLIWLSDISDEYLQKIYAACTCLLFPSEAEGFGLPLIEAAICNRPIIARNIPIFRELAQDHAYFFDGLMPADLARAIKDWMILHASGNTPSSVTMQWNTWGENVDKLMSILTQSTDHHFFAK
jgi:glycosyltransferase involved in cell wall biosynthesis